MAAVSVSTKQMEQITRDAVCMILIQHVKARLAQTGRQLARGTPEAMAKKIVARWSAPSVLAFYMLAREERFVSHSALVHLFPKFGAMLCEELTPWHFAEWRSEVAKMMTEGVASSATVRSKRAASCSGRRPRTHGSVW
jgi:hypothetical protein